ncbi:unnamed protein product [Echinostoma caproni]|uniref:SH3 domain-containing protein n=1 Tax=Echinostoma caproni TaxID=27848 RepID=A0A183AAY9_9TREM|nr:unnamed protein product [Echinostoma caproni]
MFILELQVNCLERFDVFLENRWCCGVAHPVQLGEINNESNAFVCPSLHDALSSLPVSVTGSLAGPRQNGHSEFSPPSGLVASQPSDHSIQLQPPQQQQAQLQHTASLDPNRYFGTGSGLGRHICQALFAYPASQPDELSIERGDKIRVLEKSSDGWWRGVLVTEGRPALMGWFPSNYVTLDLTKNLSR